MLEWLLEHTDRVCALVGAKGFDTPPVEFSSISEELRFPSPMASPGGQIYYCYRCDRNVRPNSPGGGELVCPNCREGFLEEVENPAPSSLFGAPSVMDGGASDPFGGILRSLAQRPIRGNPPANPGVPHMMEALSAIFQHMQTAQFQQNPDGQLQPPPQTPLQPQTQGGTGRSGVGINVGAPHPMVVFQGQMQNFLGGGNLEIFFDNGTGDGPHRLPGNVGDYFWGAGLDQLIQQLSENDPNRFGAPPAAKSAVEAMPVITISQEHLGTDASLCAVCKDAFELGTEARQMPCSHLYHSECILPWLEQHNSCPLCRYELPTDDPEYDQARAGGQSAPMRGRAGGFNISGIPVQLNVGQFPGGSEAPSDAARQDVSQSVLPSGGASGASPPPPPPLQGGATGAPRRFSITFPWFRNATTVSQSAANAQAGSSSQANSTETVSSRPSGEGTDNRGETSRPVGTGEEGDRLMPEAHQEDLD